MEKRIEAIKEAARQIAGCDITIRVGEVEPMLTAGWDAIPAGTIVYADTLRMDAAVRIYIKASNTEITGRIKTANGWVEKTAAMPNDTIKNNMLDSYITRTIIGDKTKKEA